MMNKHKIISILILIIFLVGCQDYIILQEDDINYPPINPTPKGTQVLISLYFPHREIDVLGIENRIVNLENKRIETVVIDELIKGTQKKELRNIFPNGVERLSINVEDSIAYVNYNRALIKEKMEEPEEVLIIYSIVNSLTSLEGIDKVQILIEGEKIENFKKFKINEPIEFSSLITERPYNRPITLVEEYYSALKNRDYRKLFEMESSQYENKTKYNIFELYYERANLGLANYEITDYEIIKYDNEIILLYKLKLYYSDGRITNSGRMEINIKHENNRYYILRIINNKYNE